MHSRITPAVPSVTLAPAPSRGDRRRHCGRQDRGTRHPRRGHTGWRQVAAAGDRGIARLARGRGSSNACLLGGAARQPALASGGSVRRPRRGAPCTRTTFVTLRAADNQPDPSRGLSGLHHHLSERSPPRPTCISPSSAGFRTLLVVDEVHHLPALSDMASGPQLAQIPQVCGRRSERMEPRTLLPLLESARSAIAAQSGTLQRADGRSILWLPYRKGPKARARRPGRWTSRHPAGPWSATRGQASTWPNGLCCPCYLRRRSMARRVGWTSPGPRARAPSACSTATGRTETTRPALFTASAHRLCRGNSCARRSPRSRDAAAHTGDRSVVFRPAADGAWPRQAYWWWRPTKSACPALSRRSYAEWVPSGSSRARWRRLATSDERDAHEIACPRSG